jgi:quinol monooxygenase YgiN
MTAFNVVRFRVKPGYDEEFVNAHRARTDTFPGARRFALIKTGEGAYCIVGEWDNFASIVAARPNMIENLDRIRGFLEDMGNGITDPVSGDALIDMRSNGHGRKAKRAAPKRKAAVKKRPKKKAAKKKARRR